MRGDDLKSGDLLMMKNEDCENDALFDRNSTREALELSIFCTEKQLCIIAVV